MTREDRLIKLDRMRYTKDSLSSGLIIAAIVLDALYFVSIYMTDVGTYYYNWVIGASIIYNLLFMLVAFLCSEGVKNRKGGYTPVLLVIGIMQIVRIFYLPALARDATVTIKGEELQVMEQSQYMYVVVCLAVSALCCILGGIISYINNKNLASYMKTVENKTA